jgi:hypothetical protein
MPLEGNKIDRMMEKVRALLEQADRPTTGAEEAATYRAKAEGLMREFRIEESSLIDNDGKSLITPVARFIRICLYDSPYRETYKTVASYLLHHVGAEAVIKYRRDNPEESTTRDIGPLAMWFDVVGFESDVRYFEILLTSALTYFAGRMEPAVNPALPDAVNVYNLRTAGIERINIARMMGWGTTGSATAKVTRLYKAECERRGEDAKLTGRGNSVAVYREAFATAFPNELWGRLWNARQASDGGSGALVLANREQQVKEAFYERYPHLRPSEGSDLVPLTEKERKELDKMVARAAKERERKMARLNSTSGRLGTAAGEDAARQVDILSSRSNRLED